MACLIFFAPLFALAYLLALAGGGPALIRSRLARPDGTCFTAWRFNVRRRTTAQCADIAQTRPEMTGFARFGRFLFVTRLEVLPYLYSVARGDMALTKVFQDP